MHALLAGRLAAAAAAAGGGTMRTAQHCDAPTASQRAPMACRCELAERLAEALKPQAKENQKAGGGDRKSSRAKSGLPILAEPINTREQAAKEAGVSHGSMAAFKFLKENASPEVLDEALKPKARENQKAGLETSSKRGADKSANIGEVVDTREQAAKEAGVSHGSMAAFKSKGWTQERIGEVVGMDQTTISRWLDNIPNVQAHNASTPKDCRIKLSTLPTPPARYDAPTASQRAAMAILGGGVVAMSVSRFSWDDTDRAGCRAAQMGFSLTLSTFQIYAKKTR